MYSLLWTFKVWFVTAFWLLCRVFIFLFWLLKWLLVKNNIMSPITSVLIEAGKGRGDGIWRIVALSCHVTAKPKSFWLSVKSRSEHRARTRSQEFILHCANSATLWLQAEHLSSSCLRQEKHWKLDTKMTV
jgi:hypothetical protein